MAHGDWLVLVDADTRPAPDLVDRYFDPPPVGRIGVLAGGIADLPGSSSSAARYAARRAQMSQRVTLGRAGTPYAQTANVAVRRAAFEEIGGFDEEARSGEDADLCFRLARAGWTLEERPAAVVEHPTRATLGELLAQVAHHGSGSAWLDKRYPGEFREREPAASPAGCGGRARRR